MASKRVEWLDSLRGVAMFTVVLGHVASLSKSMQTLNTRSICLCSS